MDQGSDSSHRELFRYIIASGEMRYIERTERLVFLEKIPGEVWLVRGVIPGCGSACDANLAQVILEFIMSCEGLDAETHQAALRLFAQKNGAAIVDHLRTSALIEEVDLILEYSLQCLFRSLGGEFELQSDERHIKVAFGACPLCGLRVESGLQRNGELAHIVLFDLIRTMLYQLDPAARVRLPDTYSDADHGIEIEIIRPIG